MTRPPRSEIIDRGETGTYHCWSKCVRGAYLCGKPPRGKKDYSHRREWIDQRCQEMAKWFAIDITFFAILANHFHLVLRTHPEIVERWKNKVVIERAIQIFPCKFKEMGVKNGNPTGEQLRNFAKNRKLVKEMRSRISDPSWFLRQLKQNIAVRANAEDGKKGHFFEGRFHCRAITDDAGMLSCGYYVDLNQIRADEAQSIEESKKTSAYRRLMGLRRRRQKKRGAAEFDGYLTPINYHGDDQGEGYKPAGEPGSPRTSSKGILEMTVEKYLEGLDWAGRQVRRDKRGKIPDDAPPVLAELGLTGASLIGNIENFETKYRHAIGSEKSLAEFDEKRKQRRAQRARSGSKKVD